MPEIGDPLMARYLAGDVSEDERRSVERWLAADAAHRDALARLQRLWSAVPARPRFDDDAAWAVLGPRMGLVRSTRSRVRAWTQWRRESRTRHVAWGAGSVAAAIAFALVAVWLGHPQAMTRRAAREYATGAGLRATGTLTDGTEFTLAPGSRLVLAPGYDASDREATLFGEAVFTVTHDARHPFTVRAGNAVITDVGTRFDVRAYAADSSVRVVVAEGRVLLGPSHPLPSASSTLLVAGEVAVIGAAGRITAARSVDPDAYLGWTAGRLVFTNTPLPAVAAELARWYGVRIDVHDAVLRTRDITITLDRLPLETVLALVAPAAGARVVRHGDAYTLVRLPRTSTHL